MPGHREKHLLWPNLVSFRTEYDSLIHSTFKTMKTMHLCNADNDDRDNDAPL